MVLPTPRPYAESAASLARILSAIPPPAPPSPAAPDAGPAPPSQARRLPLLVGALLAGALLVGALAPRDDVRAHPGLLLALVAFAVATDLMRIDIFDRSNVSPASVPILALAFVFGPLGPIAAELAIAVGRVVRRERAIKVGFDLGALSLAGAAASGVWSLAAPGGLGSGIAAGLPAALASYLVASVAVSVVMWFVRGERPDVAWREQFAWLWPHYLAFGALAALMVGAEVELGPRALLIFALPVLLLWVAEEQYLRRTRESVRLLHERNGALEEANGRIAGLLREAHESTLMTMATLGRAVHARDPDHTGSSERIARLARLLGQELGLSADDVHALNMGVVVHDIGAVALPTGDRDDPRRAELSAHILAPLRLPQIVMDMARHGDDRYDGAGNADGLARDGIPLAARILAVARAFDQDTTSFSSLAFEGALHELRRASGTRFCPDVVEALMTCLSRDPALRRYFGAQKEAPAHVA